MTILQEIERDLIEKVKYSHGDGNLILKTEVFIDEDELKSFLKQSFIKFLEGECERLEKSKKEGDDFQCYHTDPFGNKTPTVIEKRLSSEDKAYNQAISEQITHLQAQIKELEV